MLNIQNNKNNLLWNLKCVCVCVYIYIYMYIYFIHHKMEKAGGDGYNKDEMVGWHHWLDGCEFE